MQNDKFIWEIKFSYEKIFMKELSVEIDFQQMKLFDE